MVAKGVAALVVAVALTAVGCGSSKPLSRADFQAKVEAICTKVNNQNRVLVTNVYASSRGSGRSPAPSALRAIVVKGTANQKQALKQILALKPPDELKTTVADWTRSLESSYDETLATGTRRTPAEFTRMHNLGVHIQRLNAEIGLRACQ